MALADLPLAIVVAIFFIAPFLIHDFLSDFSWGDRGEMEVVGGCGWAHWGLAHRATWYGCRLL
jgi:hypothetical protein